MVRVECTVVIVICIWTAKVDFRALLTKKIHSKSITALLGKRFCPVHPGWPWLIGQQTLLYPFHSFGIRGIDWGIFQIAIGLETVSEKYARQGHNGQGRE